MHIGPTPHDIYNLFREHEATAVSSKHADAAEVDRAKQECLANIRGFEGNLYLPDIKPNTNMCRISDNGTKI